MYKNVALSNALAPISKLTKGSKELFISVKKDGYKILTKNSKPTFALLDISKFEELAAAKDELENLKREKFNNLVTYLQTVPKVEPTENEKQLMALYDSDLEEQQRIQRIIEQRRQNEQKINRTY